MTDRFETLLHRTIGLAAATVGHTAIRRAVATRMAAVAAADADAYYAHVLASAAELQALIDAVVVPETWFFRDLPAFAAAARIATEALPRARAAGRPIALLSLPCSTGEEPYSLAMALLGAGLPPDAFRIDAVDVSQTAIEHARRAVYGRNSFRGGDLGFRDRFFSPAGAGIGHALAPAVRECVAFRQGNLFALGEEARGGYDIVFCRNLVIYFDAAGQGRAVGVLRRLLAPDGVLFVGHAESSAVVAAGFASLRIPFAFAFRPAAEAPSVSAALPVAAPAPRRAPDLASPRPPDRAEPPPKADANRPPPSGLAGIRAAADRGEVATAKQLGEAFLRDNPASAEALALVGVVSEAAGDDVAAVRFYRQALYLDPHHADALAHLALLLERRGDASGARLVRARARRLVAAGGA